MAHYAIIGAGMAGLSALNQLASQGHKVTVFDKSRGSGGRMATKKVGTASWDMGAQFFRAHTEAFQQQLEQWQQDGIISEWQANIWQIANDQASPSPDTVKRYVATPRMTGLSRYMLRCASAFETESRIVRLLKRPAGWHLFSDDNREFGPFDKLIVAIPPEQANALLKTADDLASLRDATHVDMNPCWTLLLSFNQPLATDIDAAFVKDGPIGWISRNNSKPGRDAGESWVIQANHHWSKDHCNGERHGLMETLQNAFWQALQLPPQPHAEIWLHRWLFSIPNVVEQPGTVVSNDDSVALCGDWLQAPNIEGAWLSGNLAARRLSGQPLPQQDTLEASL